MEPTQPPPLARWNPTRDCWETTQQASLLSEHWDVFSETWPSSGMTRNGVAYALPTWEPAMAASECSSSPSDGVPLLLTPTSQLAVNGGSQPMEKRRAGGHGPTLADQIEHL